MEAQNLGWHFTLGDKLRDGRPVPAVGETLVHEGTLEIGASGLHCSERLIDALRYAPGATLYQVRFGGEIIRQKDKLCSRERTILRTLPQKETLSVLVCFSKWCARQAAGAVWAAEEAEAARWAAEAAVGAAEEAAWAAWAAWVAAEAAARAARAAEVAAEAAWAAAAEREAQNVELTRLVEEAFAKLESQI